MVVDMCKMLTLVWAHLPTLFRVPEPVVDRINQNSDQGTENPCYRKWVILQFTPPLRPIIILMPPTSSHIQVQIHFNNFSVQGVPKNIFTLTLASQSDREYIFWETLYLLYAPLFLYAITVSEH